MFYLPTTTFKIPLNTKMAHFDLKWPLAVKILTLEKNGSRVGDLSFHKLSFKKKSSLYDHFDILTLTCHFQGQGQGNSTKTQRHVLALPP